MFHQFNSNMFPAIKKKLSWFVMFIKNEFFFQVFLLIASLLVSGCRAALSEVDLKNYLQNTFEKETSDLCYRANVAEFAYATDVKNKTKEAIAVRKKKFKYILSLITARN